MRDENSKKIGINTKYKIFIERIRHDEMLLMINEYRKIKDDLFIHHMMLKRVGALYL